jgi:hypothetical protein
MLFDTAYIEDSQWYRKHPEDRLEFWRQKAGEDKPKIVKGYARRLFFDATMRDGWIGIPQKKYEELDELEGYHGAS